MLVVSSNVNCVVVLPSKARTCAKALKCMNGVHVAPSLSYKHGARGRAEILYVIRFVVRARACMCVCVVTEAFTVWACVTFECQPSPIFGDTN